MATEWSMLQIIPDLQSVAGTEIPSTTTDCANPLSRPNTTTTITPSETTTNKMQQNYQKPIGKCKIAEFKQKSHGTSCNKPIHIKAALDDAIYA